MSDPLLPPFPVEFYPNTGMEVGWCIALERALKLEGWTVAAEVQTSPGRAVDLIARLGSVLWVIEVKGRTAGPAGVTQLGGYLADIQVIYPHALGVLAAPGFTGTIRSLPDDIYLLPLVRT